MDAFIQMNIKKLKDVYSLFVLLNKLKIREKY